MLGLEKRRGLAQIGYLPCDQGGAGILRATDIIKMGRAAEDPMSRRKACVAITRSGGRVHRRALPLDLWVAPPERHRRTRRAGKWRAASWADSSATRFLGAGSYYGSVSKGVVRPSRKSKNEVTKPVARPLHQTPRRR
jgi:hypothetical protein